MRPRSSIQLVNRWKVEEVESTKADVKRELDAVEQKESKKARLAHALSRIGALAEDTTPSGNVRRYVYSMSALVYHLYHGGLSDSQVRSLGEIAAAILKLAGVRPVSSKLGYLYGDLHLVLSQILRKEGKQWESLWEHLLSFYVSQRGAASGKGYQSFTLAHHCLRMGLGPLALTHLEQAEKERLPEAYVPRVRLERIKALRLIGKIDEAAKLDEQSNGIRFSPAQQKEREWEALVRQSVNEGDVAPLILATLPKKSHHEARYVMEAFLWSRAISSKSYLERFPTLAKLSRGIKLGKRELGPLLDAVRIIETLYDSQIPYEVRLERLRDLIADLPRFPTVDMELLFWAVLSRWFARNHTEPFYSVAIAQYTSLSLLISGGTKSDALGFLADLHQSTKAAA